MTAVRISEFDLWQPGYGGYEVNIYVAGTTTPADVFLDEELTDPADNPITLLSRSDEDGTNYGKWPAPLYTADSYRLVINGTEETGIVRPPITDLDGEDASGVLVTPTGSSQAVVLADLLAEVVFAANYGTLITGDSGSAATNTSTINLAIAALSSGGEVILPAGRIKVNALNVPAGVILCGQGKSATTLESILGNTSFTITGNRAGFRKLTLDGNNLTASSRGVYSIGKDNLIFDEVTIKRFETGLHMKGGKDHIWKDLNLENMVTGAKLYGDLDAGGSGGGDLFENLLWIGGLVTVCTTKGLDLSYEDAICHNLTFNGVGFESNTGVALALNGAQFMQLDGCWWTANTHNISIQDDTATLTPATAADNDVIGIRFNGGQMNDGDVVATGTCQDVILDTMKLISVNITLNTPILNFLYLMNCTEDGSGTTSGEGTKLVRFHQEDRSETFGITTGNTQTKAWSLGLEAGQMVFVKTTVIGRQRDGAGRAIYQLSCGAFRAGSSLAYDTQTANFTAGDIITGASSGATARLLVDSDSGTTGTLTLADIDGTFLDNEIITGSTTGSALVNGVITPANVTLDTVGLTSVRTAYETDATWNAVIAANGTEIEVQVLGATSKTVEWTVSVDVVTT